MDRLNAAQQSREILKIGLAVTDGKRVLLVKKRGGHRFILPGGKPEAGEADLETLRREIHEELGCDIEPSSIQFLGSFSDVAADMVDVRVTVRLYRGELIGRPCAKSEIETLKWVGRSEDDGLLAPSLRNQILPFLFSETASQETRRQHA
jgi:8-oxo-dGTP diphosphatase